MAPRMKKTNNKLALNKETLRSLSPEVLKGVRGGGETDTHSDIITDVLKALTIAKGSHPKCIV